jgi:hypothetical protein
MKLVKLFGVLCFSLVSIAGSSQSPGAYWNKQTQLIPWRIVPVVALQQMVDLDKDGDPDVIKALLNDSIPVLFIDDDDDMKWADQQGDTDNDCILLDRNRDGIFAGPWDFSVDWCDNNKDGKADIQLVVNNGGAKLRNYWDWSADYMWFFDHDEDGIMHYIDWNRLTIQAWEHSGHANFYKDYQGNSTFLKMHASSFRINDLRYNWENPFIFYDNNKDGLTDWAIRLVDTPVFRDPKDGTALGFKDIDTTYDVRFTKKIDYAALTWDLDRDNAAGNEFDFDMSLLFKGKGFSYEKDKYTLKNWQGLSQADTFLFDARWRKIDHLFFPNREVAYSSVFQKGEWKECRLVFDEDDDCNRWERVEFYDPKDLFKSGTENGGLDHNKQADVAGDRGEFDLDNSGKGQLYIGNWDGKIHLYGAEWGAWRIDQLAYSFQGFGGNYERWGRERLQRSVAIFPTVYYKDSDANGFIDFVAYDLNGDQIFEDSVSLLKLGIDDKATLYQTASFNYTDFQKLFEAAANRSWQQGQQALKVAQASGLDTYWYNFYMYPKSLHQRYEFGYWLSFYLYQDLRYQAKQKGDLRRINLIDKAYYAGNWDLVLSGKASLTTPASVLTLFNQSNEVGVHPRLFFNKKDITRIRQLLQANDSLIGIGYRQIIKEADLIVSQPLFSYALDDAKLRVPSIHQFASQIPNLVMAYLMTNDTIYAHRAYAQLEKMASYPDWGADRHFLDAGIGAFNVALAYDGLYDYLGSFRREILRQSLVKHVLQPGFTQLKKNVWWSTAHHNWNGICNGGIIMAALSLFETDPTWMAELVSLAVNRLPNYISSFEPDGQSEEGLMYWSYGLMYTTIAFESLQRVLGTNFGLDTYPGFKKTGWFPAYVSGPITSLNIGDDPLKNSRSRSFFWFAHHYGDTLLAKWQHELCLETQTMTWMDMIYYNPSVIDAAQKPAFALDSYTKGIDVMTAQSSSKKEATYIALHGGRNNANHGHLDAGSFEIQAKGEVWAYGNLGRDEYTYPGYFSKQTIPSYKDRDTVQTIPGRWHFYRLRAEGKNCLIINPDTRPDQDEQGEAKLINRVSSLTEALYTIDLTSCYNRDVDFYYRTVHLNRSTEAIIIKDSLHTKGISRLWWQLHTKAKIKLGPDGRSATLYQNGKTMRATIVKGGKGFFADMPATYLPGQNFPLTKNSPNKDFRKLVFETGNFTEGVIEILLEPVENNTKTTSTVTNNLNDTKKELATFRLATVFQDSMVIQQAKPSTIWGWAKPGTFVEVMASWGQRVTTNSDKNGKWELSIRVPNAKKGDYSAHSLEVKAEKELIRVDNILIGEVWFCSGQSNMEMTMQALPPWHKGVNNYATEIAQANYPGIRLFKVTRETAAEPRDTVNATWKTCTPSSVASFSGVAYYFARQLQQALDIPVGIVTAAFGGASCQAFIHKEVLMADSVLRTRYWQPYVANPEEKQPHLRPSLIYNAIINPFMPFSIKGILWYQGESNAGDIQGYDYLNAALIKSWRSSFRQGELPFYFVQMTPYAWKKNNPTENGYAKFREAQSRVLSVAGTGMVCTMDVGDPDDIHPTNKKPVGERLAFLALKNTYQKKVVSSGPLFKSWEISKGKLIVEFEKSSLGSGLTTADGKSPQHFMLAGADSVFYPATAIIENNKIVLKASAVKDPVAIRYAYTNAVITNLQNKEGWPAFPFRTDRWMKETIIIN